jgi:hypothetical protein
MPTSRLDTAAAPIRTLNGAGLTLLRLPALSSTKPVFAYNSSVAVFMAATPYFLDGGKNMQDWGGNPLTGFAEGI